MWKSFQDNGHFYKIIRKKGRGFSLKTFSREQNLACVPEDYKISIAY